MYECQCIESGILVVLYAECSSVVSGGHMVPFLTSNYKSSYIRDLMYPVIVRILTVLGLYIRRPSSKKPMLFDCTCICSVWNHLHPCALSRVTIKYLE